MKKQTPTQMKKQIDNLKYEIKNQVSISDFLRDEKNKLQVSTDVKIQQMQRSYNLL
jgi:hypothetical protein